VRKEVVVVRTLARDDVAGTWSAEASETNNEEDTDAADDTTDLPAGDGGPGWLRRRRMA
jgi:hypothetical protein